MPTPLRIQFIPDDAWRDLLLTGLLLVCGFTYLDVPFGHAILTGTVLTLQAAVGLQLLRLVLPNLLGSFLLLLGPGMILGGAFSFLLFQIAGRGLLAIGVVIAVGLLAILRTGTLKQWEAPQVDRVWTLTQIMGMAALALTWEFGELLPAAAGLFVFGIASSFTSTRSRLLQLILVSGVVAILFVALQARPYYWWFVTDDYQFFEVMSRHVTVSGPFADWGSDNWTRYHWLSYGWSGLLDLLSGSPEPFVILTRVMPLLYSLSLASSLMLMAKEFCRPDKLQRTALLSPWLLLALNPLDWSGTSTSGVYAVIASLGAVVTIQISRSETPNRRLVLYLTWIPLIGLTKLPALFGVIATILLIEIWVGTHTWRCRRRTSIRVAALPLVSALVIGSIWIASRVIGGWAFIGVNPNLGQLADFGLEFAGLGLLLQKFWIWIPAILAYLWIARNRLTNHPVTAWAYAYLAIPLLSLALFMDLKVFGNANTAEYFSGPMYFLGSLVLLTIVPPRSLASQDRRRIVTIVALTTALTGAGYVWARLNLSTHFWNLMGLSVFSWNPLKISLLQWVSIDGRFATAILAAIIGIVALRTKNGLGNILLISLVMSLAALTLYGYLDHSRSEFARERSVDEQDSNLGSMEARAVGLWLQEYSDSTDIIATNSLITSSGGPASDYSLAVWSERTFLVLGPKFGRQSSVRDELTELSTQFAHAPNSSNCQELIDHGVRWFVIDRRLTDARSWDVCGVKAYASGDLELLRLTK